MVFINLTNKKDPKRIKLLEEQEDRKKRILKLVDEIKNCTNKEEKKELEERLNQIHIERYRKLQQHPLRSNSN